MPLSGCTIASHDRRVEGRIAKQRRDVVMADGAVAAAHGIDQILKPLRVVHTRIFRCRCRFR
jgi:hypothetical protein